MMSVLLLLVFILPFHLLGCDPVPESPKGFSLPQGNALAGEKVFLKYQCLACHSLEAFDYETVNRELEPPVLLGGTSTRVKTYADLVTSIINPSHKISDSSLLLTKAGGVSKMIVFNDVMTVNELVNLVKFLQLKYKVKPYEYTYYGYYEFDM
jgi:mono/diheme cytochrome c family protein